MKIREFGMAVCGLGLALGLMGCNTLTGAGDVATDGEPISEVPGASQIVAPAPNKTVSCQYAPIDLGVSLGKQIPGSLQWQGFGPGSDLIDMEPIYATQFYDCDGSKAVHAVVFETSQFL